VTADAVIAGALAGAVAGLIAGLAVAYWARPRPGRWRSTVFHQQHSYTPTVTGSVDAGLPRPAASGPGLRPFDRFNDRAKRVLALAQDEAIRFNHNYIGTEHLLLGLMREGEGIAAQVVRSLGGDIATLRRQVELTIGRGESTTSPSEITMSPRTKRVIEFAIDEARTLGQAHVGTEHLLLGVLRDTGSIAAGVLEAAGLRPDAIRERVIATLGAQRDATREGPVGDVRAPTGGGPFSRFNDRAKRVLALAQDEAIRLNHNYMGTEHLLLGLLRHDEPTTSDVLVANGVTLEKARTAVGFIVPQGEGPTPPSEITLSPRTKKVIELSNDEAVKLGSASVRPAHLLLALVREGEGIACGVIESLGVPLDKVRQDVLSALSRER
jgi:ATP-dependent Clp protease ATP-binding subunit ClpA